MNKDFWRPLLIVVIAVILVGLIAMLVPAWENDIFPIRKMSWFTSLIKAAAVEPDSVIAEIPKVEHESTALHPFLRSLAQLPVLEGKEPLLKSRKPGSTRHLRIAYYSDSTIEGDLICAPLRSEFQNVYGGKGVGMMPITSIVSGFRQTIRHSFSRNWESLSFMSSTRSELSLGITGYTFIPRPYYTAQRSVQQPDSLTMGDSLVVAAPVKTESARYYVDYDPWVEYKAVDIAGGAGRFEHIRLFYSAATDSSKVSVSYDAQPAQSFWLSSRTGVQALDISPAQGVKSVRLQFSRRDPIHVYGLSFDAPNGVYVDNYPIRGYSGMYFSRIHADVLADFQRHLDYDLVILQYGENVSNPANRDYSNYKNAMQRTLQHIQKAMPDVPVLIISAHDRSIKNASGYHTSPDIPILIRNQGELAQENDVAFWNLYEAMGGYNSMIGLVNQKPALASSDYTHFNRRGADYVAKMLLAFLTGKP